MKSAGAARRALSVRRRPPLPSPRASNGGQERYSGASDPTVVLSRCRMTPCGDRTLQRARPMASLAASRTAMTSVDPLAAEPSGDGLLRQGCDAVCSLSGTEIAHWLLPTTNTSAMRQEDVLLPSYHDNGTLRWRGVKMEGEGPRRIKALTYRFGDHPTVLQTKPRRGCVPRASWLQPSSGDACPVMLYVGDLGWPNIRALQSRPSSSAASGGGQGVSPCRRSAPACSDECHAWEVGLGPCASEGAKGCVPSARASHAC